MKQLKRLLMLQIVTVGMTVMVSAFVFLYGKNGTGIKMYYALTAGILLLVLFI